MPNLARHIASVGGVTSFRANLKCAPLKDLMDTGVLESVCLFAASVVADMMGNMHNTTAITIAEMVAFRRNGLPKKMLLKWKTPF